MKNLREQFLKTESASIDYSTLMDQSVETIYSLELGKESTLNEKTLKNENLKFLDILFDDDDCLCVCKSPFDFEFQKKSQMGNKIGRYISINPSNPNTSTRRNDDVTKFRNFLIEFDDMSITEQLSKMENLKIPYSAVTFSGNKSLHFIISLENPLSNIEEYQLISNWIHNIVNELVGNADKSTKPPSFTTRYPNVIHENGIYSQKLLKLNGRLSDEEFFGWIKNHISLKPTIDNSKRSFKEKINDALDFYIRDVLKTSLDESEWFDCPLCVEEGASKTRRMKVNKTTKSIKCYCSKGHDQNVVKKLFQIKREQGGRDE